MAAARPGPADARVPCPLCGGLIHPIAGRCKHCKGDLAAHRSARPAAAASLPALHGGARPNGHAAVNGHANGHAAAPPQPQQLHQPPPAPAPGAPALPHVAAAVSPLPALGGREDPSQPILPPRPTGRYPTAAPRASWKSWPVIVIILAVIAIVTAVILMLWPPAPTAPGASRSFEREPAPDRMDTNPAPATPRQPPATSPDPWSRRNVNPPPTDLGSDPSARAVPDDVDIDDPDLDAPLRRDLFSPGGRRGLGGIGGGGGRPGAPGDALLYAIFSHGCQRVAACGHASAPVKDLCDDFATLPPAAPPACTAAVQCLRQIDELSCDVPLDDPMALLLLEDRFPECRAARRC